MSSLLFASFSLEDELEGLGIDLTYLQYTFSLLDLSGSEDPVLTSIVIDEFLQGEEVKSYLEMHSLCRSKSLSEIAMYGKMFL